MKNSGNTHKASYWQRMVDLDAVKAEADRLSLGRSAAVRADDQRVSLVLDVTGLAGADQDRIETELRAGLQTLTGLAEIRIARSQEKPDVPILVIGSGKGGVGKSTLAANLAVALGAQGKRIALVDADIYGPSQPTLMGTGTAKPDTRDKKLVPIAAAPNVAMLSIGQIVAPGQAVAWRGPMAGNALTQLVDADWGAIDLMILDLPPGTGDLQLSIIQRHRPLGAIIVSTPQDLALIDARRAISLFDQTDVPVIGMIENMAGFQCPHCGQASDPFGSGAVEAEAARIGVAFLGRVPLTLALREASDAGKPPAGTPGTLADLFGDIAGRVENWVDDRKTQKDTKYAARP